MQDKTDHNTASWYIFDNTNDVVDIIGSNSLSLLCPHPALTSTQGHSTAHPLNLYLATWFILDNGI